jgi:LPS sulfotransferase NodH
MSSILRDLALDLGLKKGHSDFTRFIILGRSRTGSNFLRSLLGSHPGVIVYGEILKNDEAVQWGVDGMDGGGRSLKLLREDAPRFLDEVVFHKQPVEICAVGFKLFYYHAQENLARPAWDYLKAHTEIRVLHIKRRNMLRTHLSKVRAEMTDHWTNVKGEAEKEEAVTLPYEDLLADFERTSAWEHDYDAFFAAHPKIDVLYEDLAQDPPGQIDRIQKFLEIPARPLQPGTHKQSSLPLSQAIANFAELKARFAGTPWESFFEEDRDE